MSVADVGDTRAAVQTERRRLAVALALPGLALGVLLFAPFSPVVTSRPGPVDVGVRVTTPQPASSRPTQAAADWPHILRVGEVTYTAGLLNSGRPLREDDLETEIARVTTRLNGTAKPGDHDIKDGEAAYLDAGTIVYAVKGYTPKFRVAARQAGSIVLFEAFDSPSARFGRDILDIDGRVQSVAIDENDPHGSARVIARREDVAALARMVLEARIDRSKPFGKRTAYISFRLSDSTAVTLQYAAADAMLSRGITDLPSEFRRLIELP